MRSSSCTPPGGTATTRSRSRQPAAGTSRSRTGRPLTAAGIAELLRNPVYNGYLVRYRGFADEERVEAPVATATGRGRRRRRPARRRTTCGSGCRRSARSARRPGRVRARSASTSPHLVCHGCGLALYGHASNGRRRMTHPAPVCASWTEAAGSRTSFRAEVYEWQIAALLATAKLDEAAKRRIVAALSGTRRARGHAPDRPPRAGAAQPRARQRLRARGRRRLPASQGRPHRRDRGGPAAAAVTGVGRPGAGAGLARGPALAVGGRAAGARRSTRPPDASTSSGAPRRRRARSSGSRSSGR